MKLNDAISLIDMILSNAYAFDDIENAREAWDTILTFATQQKTLHEVRTNTECDGFINCWQITLETGTQHADVYESEAEALQAINDYLEDINIEVEAGNLAETYDPDDFSIYHTRWE